MTCNRDGEREKCNICHIAFQVNEIIIDDPEIATENNRIRPAVHLKCWNVEDQIIRDIFQERDTRTRLHKLSNALNNESGDTIIQGWNDLSCFQRKSVLDHIFERLSQYPLTGRDVFEYFRCRMESCTMCKTPQWCHYEKCAFPELQPSSCMKCNAPVHLMCQQAYCGFNESILCMKCHPVAQERSQASLRRTRSMSSGTTRSFPSRPSNSSHDETTVALDSPCKFILCCFNWV